MSISIVARREAKLLFLYALTAAVIAVVFTLPRIAQPQQFHDFADSTPFWGIPSFLNVASNLVFLFVGIVGCVKVYRSYVQVEIKVIYFALFTGVIQTAFGSACYHLAPDNARLVLDRIPMVIIFMSFVCAVIAEWVSVRGGALLLPVLLLLGIGSVIWWRASEAVGAGDLRPYLLVQFYPIVLIALIMILFVSKETACGMKRLGFVIGWYIVAKVLERFDQSIYQLTGFISGHTLKHVAAGIATWYMVRFFDARHPLATL